LPSLYWIKTYFTPIFLPDSFFVIADHIIPQQQKGFSNSNSATIRIFFKILKINKKFLWSPGGRFSRKESREASGRRRLFNLIAVRHDDRADTRKRMKANRNELAQHIGSPPGS
jgi:hypothetical protein